MNPTNANRRLLACVGSGEIVVDCGCGNGEVLNMLRDRFAKRIGLDISGQRLSESKEINLKGYLLRQADLNQAFPLPDNYADAVIANQVIEHIVNPFHFVSEIYRILKNDGRYFITTPNIRYIKTILKLMFSGYGPRTSGGNTQDGEWDDGHLHYFTHRDLKELFIRTGFRQVHSSASIDIDKGGLIRHALDYKSDSYVVREFLSGSIMLCGMK